MLRAKVLRRCRPSLDPGVIGASDDVGDSSLRQTSDAKGESMEVKEMISGARDAVSVKRV